MAKAIQSYILFELGRATFAIVSVAVQELEMVGDLTPVPNVPPYVEGIILVRGRVVPVVNLRARFGMERIPRDSRARIIVIQVGERTVGLLVDTAREFLEIPPEAVQPPPDTLSDASRHLLEGVAVVDERLILLLRVDELLSASEEEVLLMGEEVVK